MSGRALGSNQPVSLAAGDLELLLNALKCIGRQNRGIREEADEDE